MLVLDAKASLVAVLETVIAPQSVLEMTMMQICVRECNDGDIDLCAGDRRRRRRRQGFTRLRDGGDDNIAD